MIPARSGFGRAALAGSLALTMSAQAQAQMCDVAPDPVLTLDFASRYTDDDATRDTVDDAAEAAAEAALGPLDDFIRDLATATDAMLSEPDATVRADRASCLMSQLADWARADALATLATRTVKLTIGSRLSAFGIVALRAQAHGADPAEAAEVTAWLRTRMREQMTFWETAPSGASRGNLRAWAALAGAAIAGLSDDPVIRGWAAWSIIYVTCTASPDGSLPREMERGRRALHYQLHALAPLVTATLLLERQGMPVLTACDGALDRAVRFALSDLETGALTTAISGEPQTLLDGTDPLEPFQLAWIEAYLMLDGDPETKSLAESWAELYRPFSYSKLGGNQTLIWTDSAGAD